MMEETVRLELFTIAEVRDWLMHNHSVRGLSEKLMSKTRAYAIVNNPYAQDDMYIISAIFVGDEVAAYTAVFPEKLARPDRFVYWDTTLYVAPQYEGRGYAAIVIGQICEHYGADYFDHAAADASVQNFRFLDIPVSYVPQYILGPKAFAETIAGNLLKCIWRVKDVFRQLHIKKRLKAVSRFNYALEYISFIDDDTYRFIKDHSEGDVFLRTKETFNWILKYSFVISTPLFKRVQIENAFSAYSQDYSSHAVKVLVNEKLVGFYIFKIENGNLIVKYLYYDLSHEDEVFASLFEHVCSFAAKTVYTYSSRLADYLHVTRYFHKKVENEVPFAYPKGFEYDSKMTLQLGDGDMFT